MPQEQVARLISSDRSPHFEIESVAEARAEPPLRGERFLRAMDSFFVGLNAFLQRLMPASLNPFAQMGAVVNTTFVIALVTGILLLFWYSPSVIHAYESILDIEASPFLASWIRSLHRYSSDACMLFASLHGFHVLFARKVGGARWVAWVTGVVLIGMLWFDGWTGYWLVWDERAQQVAVGTAQLVDALPLFPDPLTRSFLTDGGVNSLFFFIVFFMHMLIPLAFGVALWMHLMRLNKSAFITNRPLTMLIVASLIVLSILWPATAAGPARMQHVPQGFTADWFYLLPLYLTDRLQGGVLWLLVLTGSALATSVPWLLAKKRAQPAVVHEESCNGCTQCYIDCPYNAVLLLPREDGRGENPVFARVDPVKCVGCGICVGSCDSNGIDQARLPALDVRRWINHHASSEENGEGRYIAFICAESAGAGLHIDPEGYCEALPGYSIVPVPCAGWVHMLTVERALRHGAKGVLIAGCGVNPSCRKGPAWTEERLQGKREPLFRLHDEPDGEKVRFVRFDRADRKPFLKAAAAFKNGQPPPKSDDVRRRVLKGIIGGMLLFIMVGGLIAGFSDAYYRSPVMHHSELVVAFKHAGKLVSADEAADTDQEDRLSHMRGATTGRTTRVPVRLRVLIDGEERINRSYEPGGLFKDGSSVAIESFDVAPGSHDVEVYIGDTEDREVWSYQDKASLTFKEAERRVVQFDMTDGFRRD